jgi:oxygen-dependent protoporphyrinogen oxidase
VDKQVIVVGAGMAGLAAAFRLRQQGFAVMVLEAADRVGGRVTAIERDGYVLNTGATLLCGSYAETFALADEVGVGSGVRKLKASIGIVRDGRPHWLRGYGAGAVVDFLRTKVISTSSKLRLLRILPDVLRSRSKADFGNASLRAELDTESIADYCDRKLNTEIRDHLLDPAIGGLYVFDSRPASVADMYFTLTKILGGGMCGYEVRIDFLARELAARLDVRLQADVSRIEHVGERVRVSWTQGGSVHVEEVDGVVVTTPAPVVPKIYPDLEDDLQAILLESIEMANLGSLRLALRSKPAVEGTLMIVPSDELGGIATVLMEHEFSAGSAPPGRGLVGVLIYHEWLTPRLQRSDEELFGELMADLEKLIPGITELVEFYELTRWQPGAIRTRPGTHRAVAALDSRLEERRHVQLAGDYMTMPSINGSVVSGEEAARRLAKALS